ncbi:OsmC family peroxiredoxin [Haloferula sargassicola]|uniref:Peroxiredoxin OsmC n=1 Tax=Haloferula sargassicola TaxID=490096 RepID=A0ABP9UNZ0_9BACT
MKTITRKAEADWKGNLEQGHGLVTTDSQVLVKQEFSFSKRTSQGDHVHTNPEELIAAGLASCFSMALSATLGKHDMIAEQLVVTAGVTLSLTDDGPVVDTLQLDVAGMVEGHSEEEFRKAVEETQQGCPIYKLLEPGFKNIEVNVTLNN